eukprot:TRINITY_DN5186_c0_g3_i1.p1 TRINITY_DN5186_c0_g3~~TRINITY_DN5186_c0_g3_i1.p1  ORF type:complete len:375 (+),score=118.76 TRINITY_DN5186_c0_g3_i1:82-1206(+)
MAEAEPGAAEAAVSVPPLKKRKLPWAGLEGEPPAPDTTPAADAPAHAGGSCTAGGSSSSSSGGPSHGVVAAESPAVPSSAGAAGGHSVPEPAPAVTELKARCPAVEAPAAAAPAAAAPAAVPPPAAVAAPPPRSAVAPAIPASVPPVSAATAEPGGPPVWEFSVRDGFEAFPTACQLAVEELYQKYLKCGNAAKVGKVVAAGRPILLDFGAMQQHVEGSSRKRGLQRRLPPPEAPKKVVAGETAAASPSSSTAAAAEGVAGARAALAPPPTATEAASPVPPCKPPCKPPEEALLKRSQAVVWEFSVKDGFKAFEKVHQAAVEGGYKLFKAGSGPDKIKVAIGGSNVVIMDFVAMRQSLQGSATGRSRELRRRVL